MISLNMLYTTQVNTIIGKRNYTCSKEMMSNTKSQWHSTISFGIAVGGYAWCLVMSTRFGGGPFWLVLLDFPEIVQDVFAGFCLMGPRIMCNLYDCLAARLSPREHLFFIQVIHLWVSIEMWDNAVKHTTKVGFQKRLHSRYCKPKQLPSAGFYVGTPCDSECWQIRPVERKLLLQRLRKNGLQQQLLQKQPKELPIAGLTQNPS